MSLKQLGVKFFFKMSASSLCDWRDLIDSLPPMGDPEALTEQSRNFSGCLRTRQVF